VNLQATSKAAPAQATLPVEIAVLGGGCFWCTEAALLPLRGVARVTPGYCGGRVDAPSYAQVCRGDTGHIEVVQVVFDPTRLPFKDLLTVFFAAHDPTSRDRQGGDVGEQYRSVIFWQTPAQQMAAVQLMHTLNQQQVFDAPIVTQLRAPARFWPAEPEHVDYFRRNPQSGFCQAVIAPKVAALRRTYAERYENR